ncbi:MAG: HDOD domain-containing protein [Candidatus Krumholzibacteriota bacterium]
MTVRNDILAKVRTIPSMPSAVVKLKQYLSDPDVSFDELAKVIEFDPGLTANLLQLANSAYFGWSGHIKTVKEAVTRLGTNRIFQMVLCMSVAPLVRKPVKGYDMGSNGLWHHSIATAICAEQLAGTLDFSNPEEAFTAGLLHDMGKILLGTFVEIDDEPIKNLVENESLSFNEAERRVLGIDHAEAAAELLQYWKLPENVVAAARWHHDPDQADEKHRDIVDLVHVADILCIRMGWGIGTDGPLYCLNNEVEERLGVDAQVEDIVTDKVGAAIDDLQGILQGKPEPVLS